LRIDGFEENQRDELISRLSALEIGVNVHYIPIPMMSYFKGLRLDILDFPMSYKLFKNEISLPIYNNLSLDKVEHVCLKLKEIVDEIFYRE
jgi:dTDP-4-amino-4,6-dideoxygalactose transaminase